MARLTEEMVVARTKTSELGVVKKLNCWGSDLEDVSLVRRLTNVEVLSLSLNKIKSLSDFQYCRNLVELYVRRNEIRDLSELCYLQELPRLRRLLLTENPCVETAGSLYRATVLRCLPDLEILDNTPVEPEEVALAQKTGLILEHPLSVRRNTQPQEVSPEPYYANQQPESPPAQRRTSAQYEYEDENNYAYNNRANNSQPNQSSPEYFYQNGEDRKSPETTITTSNPISTTISNGAPNKTEESVVITTTIQSNNNNGETNSRRSSASPNEGYYGNGRDINGSQRRGSFDYHSSAESYYEEPQIQQQRVPPSHILPRPPSQGRKQRGVKTSNLLSAVLCLIPELDSGSLEVVEMAIRRRLDELTTE